MMDMDIIYADRLFCINFIVDYLLLLITGRLCALELKRRRYVLGAVLGGAYAVLAVLPGMDFLAEGPVKLAMAAAMVLAAFGGERKLVRPALTFLAVSAALGGGIWALSMFSGGLRSTAAVVPVSLRTLVMAFALCYALVSLAFHRFGKRAERRLCRVELEFLGGRTAFQALEDSGNELTDPVSGCAVMVAERRALEAVLPELPAEADAAAILERAGTDPRCQGRFRLVPYSAVGVESALLAAFRPDRLTVDGRVEKGVLVAVAPNRLCADGEYSAVF